MPRLRNATPHHPLGLKQPMWTNMRQAIPQTRMIHSPTRHQWLPQSPTPPHYYHPNYIMARFLSSPGHRAPAPQQRPMHSPIRPPIQSQTRRPAPLQNSQPVKLRNTNGFQERKSRIARESELWVNPVVGLPWRDPKEDDVVSRHPYTDLSMTMNREYESIEAEIQISDEEDQIDT